jgi:hypothetical protein
VTLLALLFFRSTITAAPGDLDPTFSGDGKLLDWLSRSDDSARGIAVQTDGKIVVAGSSVTGLSFDFSIVPLRHRWLARYNIRQRRRRRQGHDGHLQLG